MQDDEIKPAKRPADWLGELPEEGYLDGWTAESNVSENRAIYLLIGKT